MGKFSVFDCVQKPWYAKGYEDISCSTPGQTPNNLVFTETTELHRWNIYWNENVSSFNPSG